jgi:subtilisin family serine protease
MKLRLLGLVVTALALAVSGAQAATGATAGEKDVIVGFAAPPAADEVAFVERIGGRVTHTYKYISAVAATIPADQEMTLAAQPGVAYVQDDLDLYLLGGRRQTTDYGVAKIEAPAAWKLGARGKGVKVGIFDSGIDLEHPDLRVAGGIDLIGDGHGLDDCNGHGTHVAGIVGARDNGKGTVGVAPESSLYAMRFFDCEGGGATKSRELQGLEWAIDNGMQVINMSFGCCSIGGAVVTPLPDPAEEAMLNEAYTRGIVLIAASGNSAVPPAGGPGEPVVSYPAGYASVVAVGATDANDELAQFSSWGTDQELTAPGVSNLSTVPVGTGQTTDLTVDTDGGRALDAIALEFAGLTSKDGLTASTIYAGLGSPADFALVDCTGKTALVTRGGPTFAQKVEFAMNDGCAAVVIHNNQPGNFNGTLGTPAAPDGRAWIPAVSISLDEGLYLKDQIDSKATTTTLVNVVGDYAMFSGTSMASPHVSGVAALVRGKNLSLAPDAVRQVLRSSADDRGVAGWDPLYGYGRVNARKAVAATP